MIEIKDMSLEHLENIKDVLNSEFDDFWNYNILKEELNSQNSCYIVVLLNNEIVGFAGIKFIVNEADIMNIVTKKTFRNKGIGKLLLENLIQLAKSLNLTSITLEVNEENAPAIHLYKKFDFEILGFRKNYYQNKDGIIMTKKL